MFQIPVIHREITIGLSYEDVKEQLQNKWLFPIQVNLSQIPPKEKKRQKALQTLENCNIFLSITPQF